MGVSGGLFYGLCQYIDSRGLETSVIKLTTFFNYFRQCELVGRRQYVVEKHYFSHIIKKAMNEWWVEGRQKQCCCGDGLFLEWKIFMTGHDWRKKF